MSQVSRRTLVRGAVVGATALAAGPALNIGQASAAAFVKGADISWLPQMEAGGYTFRNSSGTQQDLFTILKGYGITAVRLRTFVSPSSDPSNGHCSIDETAALAKRAKAAGMQVMIDYHFGDTWNSVGVQNPPAAWASMSYAQMLDAMYDYVFHTMNVVKANGVTPVWVQIGNEINTGICRPTGALAYHPDQMTGLLNAAHDMVKTVFPSASVLIHLAQPQKYDAIKAFLDAYVAHGGKWDITAFSSYGSASAAPGIVGNMNSARQTYGKPVMQVEFGGRVDRPDATRAALEAYITNLKSIGGLGLFYWEPEGYSPFTSYNMGAWDASTRRPTTVMNGFLNA
ncbi:glycosyl hydrolase 53 family protein [Streptomyces sp. ME19-01-6]|uniref:glycosyl hydrolase 53 family protein n=1 Tax=Streptomyces sp. ME19-01-6 TaxID=3028686 RepID=UPI0029ABDF60|nr:glycosyl hydrolase 53 family protein [Streptomyces sp. ME19-01-6]MDX3229731.1 glycosyl hydrolase 53 family protein [Streptomyces sp. ME19-01-6]